MANTIRNNHQRYSTFYSVHNFKLNVTSARKGGADGQELA